MKSKKKILLIIIILILLILTSFIGIFLGTYSHSEPIVEQYLVSDESVKVEQIDNYYFFDGPGEGTAIIFYPGAKVEAKSYAPLLHKLAENGTDCFLVKMPCNIAFFGADSATKIIEKYDYKDWYVSGHSMGGAVAAIYTSKNSDKVSGAILLAAYPTKPISNTEKLLLIYGTNDGVLKMDKYNDGKQYWNENTKEVVIEGGNHSQFGYYGKQKKDKDATISAENQQEQTINAVMEFINN